MEMLYFTSFQTNTNHNVTNFNEIIYGLFFIACISQHKPWFKRRAIEHKLIIQFNAHEFSIHFAYGSVKQNFSLV